MIEKRMSATNLTQAYRERVWRIVHSIPQGRVSSYGAVAKLAGLPRGARLIGRILSQLPAGSALPWHRVIKSSGSLSFPPGSAHYREQRERLLSEGIEFSGDKINLKRFGWND
ncbi:MAG TPA: MGMT family protein [Spongiibacteraceae bacterium]|jgi:methylated-DNA-protein-cysteine methyltransferase-like protein